MSLADLRGKNGQCREHQQRTATAGKQCIAPRECRTLAGDHWCERLPGTKGGDAEARQAQKEEEEQERGMIRK